MNNRWRTRKKWKYKVAKAECKGNKLAWGFAKAALICNEANNVFEALNTAIYEIAKKLTLTMEKIVLGAELLDGIKSQNLHSV